MTLSAVILGAGGGTDYEQGRNVFFLHPEPDNPEHFFTSV